MRARRLATGLRARPLVLALALALAPLAPPAPAAERLPPGALVRCGGLARDDGAIPRAVAFGGQEGASIVLATEAGALRRLDLASGRTLAKEPAPPPPRKGVRALAPDGSGLVDLLLEGAAPSDPIALAPDRKLVATGGRGLRIWDAGTGALLRRVERIYAHTLSWARDGSALAVAGEKDPVRVFAMPAVEERAKHAPPEGGIAAVALSPDGARLAIAGRTGGIRIVAAESGEEEASFDPLPLPVAALAFAPDGAALAAAVVDGSVFIVGGEGAPRRLGGPIAVRAVAFAPDGKTIAAGSDDGALRLFEAATGRELERIEAHPGGPAFAVAFSPDGTTIATAGHDRAVRLFAAAPPGAARGEPRTLAGHEEPVFALAFSKDGALLASGGVDLAIRLWDVAAGGAARATLAGHTWWVNALAFSPDRKLLASCDDRALRLWDVDAARELRALDPGPAAAGAVGFLRGGKWVATGERIFDVATGRVLASRMTPRSSPEPVKPAAFAPAGTFIAAGAASGTIHVWDVATGGELRTFEGHEGSITALAFAPDGKRLASGSEDGTVLIWDVRR